MTEVSFVVFKQGHICVFPAVLKTRETSKSTSKASLMSPTDRVYRSRVDSEYIFFEFEVTDRLSNVLQETNYIQKKKKTLFIS